MPLFFPNKNIKAVIKAIKSLSAGNFGARVDTAESGGVLRELSDSVNELSATLKGKIDDLEKEKRNMRAILNSMFEGVIVVDKDLRIVSFNPTIEKIFGVAISDSRGRFILEVIRNNDILDLIKSALDKREFVSRELSLSWPVSGVFQVNVSPIMTDNGVSGSLAVIHDISEIRRLEKIRSDFVANVSHELKTPLTSIKGFTETLLDGALEDKVNRQEFIKIIQEHALRLESLVNDLLELSYIESKEINLNLENTLIYDLTSKVLSGLKSQTTKKMLYLENNLPKDLLLKIDKERIEHVLINLIENAIKFNRQSGAIKIYSQNLGDKIKVIVEDSGIGIPQKDISRIFERFYRVDKARSRELGGTGLGLSIVKHIIELHGGSIGVESAEGLGSKFFFIMPRG